METAYEKSFVSTNPMLTYRCLSELDWIGSKKVKQYLLNLNTDNSISSKLTLLYYWSIKSYSPEFRELLKDNDLISFIVPRHMLTDLEREIDDRLFAFENYISEKYNANDQSVVEKGEFQNKAKEFFENYSKVVDTQADKQHQEFIKRLGRN